MFFLPNFSSIGLLLCDCELAIDQSNETVKLTEFDLLTLKFYHERELRRWQPGVSDTLDHGDTF